MNRNVKAIIVDDEQSARDNLKYLVNKYCNNINVVAESNRIETAVEQIEKWQPELVFLDIEMPQKNGFELFKYFKDINFQVIFITAYNNYAVKAFEVSAIDYLLKPIDIERLKQAEQKVLQQNRFKQNLEALKINMSSSELKNISIPYKSDFTIVQLDDILFIQASRAYSDITVLDSKNNTTQLYTYAKKLAFFEEYLPSNQFIRVHRSWIININFIQSYSKKDKLVTLKNNFSIPISKTYKDVLKRTFLF